MELAVDGIITPEQAGKIKIIKQHYEDLQFRKADLEIDDFAVVSEIGVNMDVFPSAKHICS